MHKFYRRYKEINIKLQAWLSDKSIWVFWAACTMAISVFFGLCYFATMILTINWWIAIVSIGTLGIAWGTFAYQKKGIGVK